MSFYPGIFYPLSPALAPSPLSLIYAAHVGAGTDTTAPAPVPAPMKDWPDPILMETVCRFPVRIAFFFDGTGNNREADAPLFQHTNVARLFLAHRLSDQVTATFKYYIPGLGTYFKDVGDPGNTTPGLAFAAWGEKRLQWAMQQLELTLLKYPPKQIQEIRLSLFGFSRGAALARAFAQRIAARAKRDGSGWVWNQPSVPVRIIFMGLFDTVASVGLPASSSMAASAVIAGRPRWLAASLKGRALMQEVSVMDLAFGSPGADPTPGNPDGHSAWASKQRIPALAERCLHLVAAHEQRNSFPLDSMREDAHYPSNCTEILYPGMHSDVGGGYLPGFQTRSPRRQEMLSNIPLLAMHKAAIEAQVPLQPIGHFTDSKLESDYEVAPELLDHFQHYLAKAGNGGKSLGQGILNHMQLYFAWRFQRIARSRNNKVPGLDDAQEADWAQRERDYAAQRTAAEREKEREEHAPARQAAIRALKEADARVQEKVRAMTERIGDSGESFPVLRQAVRDARVRLGDENDAFLRANARLAAVAGDSLANLHVYDQQLMSDAQTLQDCATLYGESRPLRPHYAGLLKAYKDEFIHHQGLRDQIVIAFFDRYVHDSLASFAKDATLPSDPRCFYIGGDREAAYAQGDTDIDGVETAVG
jgi:type VI secretion system (T6SS) phospholipase Tle1-like effector